MGLISCMWTQYSCTAVHCISGWYCNMNTLRKIKVEEQLYRHINLAFFTLHFMSSVPADVDTRCVGEDSPLESAKEMATSFLGLAGCEMETQAASD